MEKLSRQILGLEKQEWRNAAEKEAKIKAELKISVTKYYMLLNRLIDSREALEYSPALVKRLRAVREKRVALRTGNNELPR
ncbi:MAG: DUF3263 domain-containing protein [Micrococcaceae bacterium]